jgi:hypothetical protein
MKHGFPNDFGLLLVKKTGVRLRLTGRVDRVFRY